MNTVMTVLLLLSVTARAAGDGTFSLTLAVQEARDEDCLDPGIGRRGGLG